MSDSNSLKSFRFPNDRPALMGILNVTPDSFSDGGRYFSFEDAVRSAMRMVEEGADVIDVGGESTRPGAEPVTAEEEARRVIPVIQALIGQGISVSIDTMKPTIAGQALDAGAFLVNDVSGFRDPAMFALVVERKCSVCVMHMQGEPRTMQTNPQYDDVVADVRSYLVERGEALVREGLERDQVWIDPGIGFGKTSAHNIRLLNELNAFAETGFPVLIGVSRKSFIGKILGSETKPLPVGDRLEGTLAAQIVAQLRGAKVIRAHDVSASRRAIDMTAAIVSD